ncbi:MAG: SDR family NAD(P)-dependent oxidoreductase [Ilumatobacteraceae bacterium]
MELKDRVVVVTGGGSGIGEALAVAAHREGARHVVVADLHAAEAERVAASIGGTGVGVDVRDEAAIVRLVDDTQQAHGPIDLFVSNAGFVTAAGPRTRTTRSSGCGRCTAWPTSTRHGRCCRR